MAEVLETFMTTKWDAEICTLAQGMTILYLFVLILYKGRHLTFINE
jgi:hypothetical protein